MASLLESEATFNVHYAAEPAAAALSRKGLAGGVADATALVDAMQALAPGMD